MREGEKMDSKLMEILKGVRPDVDFEHEEELIDDEILTSFDIIAIVSELNVEYGIEIQVDDLLPENFNSAQAIEKLVNDMQDE